MCSCRCGGRWPDSTQGCRPSTNAQGDIPAVGCYSTAGRLAGDMAPSWRPTALPCGPLAAGIMPCFFVFDGGATLATPGGVLIRGGAGEGFELAARGSTESSAAERDHLPALQSEPQQDRPATTPCGAEGRGA